MTTDDLREIEAALTEWGALCYLRAGEAKTRPAAERVSALIRQKLEGNVAQKPATSAQPSADFAQNDAEHERAVEAWRKRAVAIRGEVNKERCYVMRHDDIDEALRLMRARPVADKAAGELLRAAKEATNWLGHCHDDDFLRRLGGAIEAAERAGVR